MAVYSPSGSGNVHVDQVLTNISIQFPINSDFIGSTLFPKLTVQKQSDKYGIFDREFWKLEKHDVRAPGSLANEIPGMTWSLDTYYANEHALQIAVTDEERTQADAPLTPDADGALLVTQRILLGREKAMKDIATNTANYASGHTVTLSGTTQWNDYVNSNPISDFRTAQRTIHSKLFQPPNTAIIPWLVMSTLEDHPDFIERIKYSERGIVSQELISALFQIPEVVVPGTGIQTSAAGQAVTLGYLWAKDIVMAYVPARPGQKIPAFAYEFVWGYPGAGAQAVERWSEIRRKSDLVRVGRRYDVKMTAVDASNKSIAGYVIKSAVA